MFTRVSQRALSWATWIRSRSLLFFPSWIFFNVIFLSASGLLSGLSLTGFPFTIIYVFSHACCILHSSLPSFDFTNEQYKPWSCLLCLHQRCKNHGKNIHNPLCQIRFLLIAITLNTFSTSVLDCIHLCAMLFWKCRNKISKSSLLIRISSHFLLHSVHEVKKVIVQSYCETKCFNFNWALK